MRRRWMPSEDIAVRLADALDAADGGRRLPRDRARRTDDRGTSWNSPGGTAWSNGSTIVQRQPSGPAQSHPWQVAAVQRDGRCHVVLEAPPWRQ